MDISGAKALKERLAQSGAGTPPAADPAEVPADAPPVYHWTGKVPLPASPSETEDDSPPRSASLFSRRALSFR